MGMLVLLIGRSIRAFLMFRWGRPRGSHMASLMNHYKRANGTLNPTNPLLSPLAGEGNHILSHVAE